MSCLWAVLPIVLLSRGQCSHVSMSACQNCQIGRWIVVSFYISTLPIIAALRVAVYVASLGSDSTHDRFPSVTITHDIIALPSSAECRNPRVGLTGLFYILKISSLIATSRPHISDINLLSIDSFAAHHQNIKTPSHKNVELEIKLPFHNHIITFSMSIVELSGEIQAGGSGEE